MRRWFDEHLRVVTGILVLAGVALGIVLGLIVRVEEQEPSQQEQPVAQETQGGGAEVTPSAPAPRFEPWYLFPIAESDFVEYTSPFGHRISPILGVEMYHQGLDIHAVWRAEVVAVADGVIEEHWPSPGTPYPGGGYYRGHDVYGGMVLIRHGDGKRTRYAHLHSTRVHTGDRVVAGQVIGRVGGTGKSRGEHLHFEVILDDEALNPLLYIPNYGSNSLLVREWANPNFFE